MARPLLLPFLLPMRVQSRGMRLSALRTKRRTDSERGLTQKKLPARHRPKRDPTVYGIPRATKTKGLQRPAKGERPEYDNHPLWAFFHDKQPLDAPHAMQDYAGRSWTAPELRTKSFDELHKLWYIILKERNVLHSQQQEFKRERINPIMTNLMPKVHRCRKSLARIKYVLNERRRAATEAGLILARERKAQGLSPLQFEEQDLAGKRLYPVLRAPPLVRKQKARPVKPKRRIVSKTQRLQANARASAVWRQYVDARKSALGSAALPNPAPATSAPA